MRYDSWQYTEEPAEGGGGGDEPPAAPARASKILAELAQHNPAEYSRLSISVRKVPSNLYV